MHELSYFDISNTKIFSDLPNFSNNCNLTDLPLYQTNIKTVNVSQCKQLTSVILNETPIKFFPNRYPENSFNFSVFPLLEYFITQKGSFENTGLSLEFFCSQPNLIWLNLDKNSYTGIIPDCLKKLSNLKHLSFQTIIL